MISNLYGLFLVGRNIHFFWKESGIIVSIQVNWVRSPLTPLNQGGTGFKVPLCKGDLGGSKTTPESLRIIH
jgi:hypothetical protein